VANGVLYAGSYDFNLYALNAMTGAELWSFPTGNQVFTSPVVANGMVYFGSGLDNIYAFSLPAGGKKK
jgi:outer membrane protein assembly factor BamB